MMELRVEEGLLIAKVSIEYQGIDFSLLGVSYKDSMHYINLTVILTVFCYSFFN
ncbi:hypothetical protein J2S74_004095 [Evansella vedderi]|uniref:Uncharacterized protein n=1 Tax=Evansella vedderi TaxID=38282 RepID=A0ABU0A1T6_9BACI|nr:hypothetical protein [Evansella vedderi]